MRRRQARSRAERAAERSAQKSKRDCSAPAELAFFEFATLSAPIKVDWARNIESP